MNLGQHSRQVILQAIEDALEIRGRRDVGAVG
jgi:hypothetical protein